MMGGGGGSDWNEIEGRDADRVEGGRGSEAGGVLVPFSLEEITCVVSETVSASSSPYR